MYSIIVGGREIGIVEHPVYIRLQDNGYFRLAEADEAQGINYNGQHYQLYEREDMGKGFPEAMLIETDGGERIRAQQAISSIAFVSLAQAGTIDGVTAGEHPEMFAEWVAEGVQYTQGQIVRYSGKLYQCIQAHKSQADWTPDTAVSLWKEIANPNEEWPEWSQPIGAHDAYQTGDKVSYNGKHYRSKIDNNVWTPDAYPDGWEEVSE